jgi:hypothetical protein
MHSSSRSCGSGSASTASRAATTRGRSGAHAAADRLQRLVARMGLRGHGPVDQVVVVAHRRDDARTQHDVLALQPVRKALAVHPLVVLAHDAPTPCRRARGISAASPSLGWCR